jgi:hypothetical protein
MAAVVSRLPFLSMNHPELPRLVVHLATVAEVELLGHRVAVEVGDGRVRRRSRERVAGAEVVVGVGHLVHHLVRQLTGLDDAAGLCKDIAFLNNRIMETAREMLAADPNY